MDCREHRGWNEKNGHASYSHAAYNLEGKTDMSTNKWKTSSSEVKKCGSTWGHNSHNTESSSAASALTEGTPRTSTHLLFFNEEDDVFLTWWCNPSSGFPGGSAGKNLPAMQEFQETQVPPLGQKGPLRRAWQPIPAFLPGKSHGQRSLVGCSP